MAWPERLRGTAVTQEEEKNRTYEESEDDCFPGSSREVPLFNYKSRGVPSSGVENGHSPIK